MKGFNLNLQKKNNSTNLHARFGALNGAKDQFEILLPHNIHVPAHVEIVHSLWVKGNLKAMLD